MRVKLLRERDAAGVLLVYPSTLSEYWEAIEVIDRRAAAGSAGPTPADAAYVVTTSALRHRWGLPDLAATGPAPMVEEAQAFGLLAGGPGPAADPDEPPADPAETAGEAPDTETGAAPPETGRLLATARARLEQMLGSLVGAGPPRRVRETLRDELHQAVASGERAVDHAAERARTVLSLPWRSRTPERFDPADVVATLDRTHGGLDRVKARLVDLLAACPQTRGPLTVEGPRPGGGETGAPALVVRPAPPGTVAAVPCLAGPSGTGKTSLAVAVADALGRPHVLVPLGGEDLERLLGGSTDGAGRIVEGLCAAGVSNPVFIVEAVDRVDEEAADALLDVLDPARRTTFRDRYVDTPFDLSGAVWLVTATESDAIAEPMRQRLTVIELPGYSEDEKLSIAERYLLARPFDGPGPADWLSPEPAAEALEPAPAAPPDGPAVVLDRQVASARELERLSAGAAETWRTAASTGHVRFEREAIRKLIRAHTDEAGVAELGVKLAAVCREVVRRRPPGAGGPDVVTPAVVRDVLGEGAGDPLLPAVRAAIARERRRLSLKSDGDAAPTSDWIEWLETLPWTRRAEAPIDLAQARRVLDANHAGLDGAKACILEHLAVRRRNPRGAGAVLCFAGPPGVGKTSLAKCTAEALGRGFARLACGGLRDETDLRGHNRTWRNAQPGAIVRELRRVGSNDPVFVLDEIDKLGRAPAAVLLEVLDPAQNAGFRDAFVELPFDLSEVLFITTANETARIPPALRDRLEIVELPGYNEAEKVAIAETHLVGAQNRAAGLTAAPVRFTRGACRRIIRDYTSERGIRQLTRCLRTICRKVALGLETGDAALVRDRIGARQVRAYLGEPIGQTDGLDRLGERVDAPGLPPVVGERGRQLLARLSAWAPTDPDHVRAREQLECLVDLPWTARTEAPLDLARARAILDGGHGGHAAAKEHLLDYMAVRQLHPDVPAPLLCLVGPSGVGKTSLAGLLAAALGRARAPVACNGLTAAALRGARSGRAGRIAEQLRRVGVRNPLFVLDEIDRLDDAGAAAALVELLDPAPGATFRDHYLDLPLDVSGALFVATATDLGSAPAVLRERMTVIELSGYTDLEKRVIATDHLLPLALAFHRLTADDVRFTDAAVDTIVRGYTRKAGVWGLAGALGAVCGKVVRRRAEGDEAAVEVTPALVAGMLGAPQPLGVQVAGRGERPGIALGLCRTGAGGGAVMFIEASRMPGSGALTLTGRQGEVMRESARTALSWLRANARRYDLDPAFHRDTDIHLHVQAGDVPKEGASAGVTMAAALVSALTGRPLRGDIAMTGELGLGGQVLPVGGIKEKVLAAHRRGLARVVLPLGNRKQVDEDLGDDLRRAVAVDYVAGIDELLELTLGRVPAPDAMEAPPARTSRRD